MIDITLIEYILAIISGVAVGFSLGLIGGGGSILAVPLFIYFVGIHHPHLAIGTTALAVGITAYINFVQHLRKKNANVKLGPGMVYSSDIMPVNNPDLTVSDPLIPIIQLKKNQAMLVTCEAILGRGKEHAKWQATSGVSYKLHRNFHVTKAVMDNWLFYKETCPKSVISENENTIVFTDDIPCSYLSQLMERDGVVVEESESKFIFKFETDGSLKAADVLSYVLQRLEKRFTILMESLSD